MATAAQAAQAANKGADAGAAPTKAKRERRSWSVGLDGSDGGSLRVVARLRRDGTAQSFVVHTTKDGKKKRHARGATENHATIDAALARQEKLVVDAAKLGWKVHERAGGFARKPDAFAAANLPRPGKK